MSLVLTGAALMLASLALLLAMVARALEPGLALSLLAYGALVGGMVLGAAGVTRHLHRRAPEREE